MKRYIAVLTIVALFGGLAGCGGAGDARSSIAGVDQVEGTITISGAWALYPLMVRWGEEFQKVYPDVRVDISAGGAGKGLADAVGGAVDIGMVSREISPEEEAKG
ncbi:MAG: phosphate ABC transporter substrate-binding protein, partial [Chloroflexi bacterium]